jgi:hypothetical protein
MFLSREIAFQITVAATVEINGLVVEFAKLAGPEIGVHGFKISRDVKPR